MTSLYTLYTQYINMQLLYIHITQTWINYYLQILQMCLPPTVTGGLKSVINANRKRKQTLLNYSQSHYMQIDHCN